MGSSQSKTLFRRVQARQLPIGLVPSEPAYVSIQCDPIGGHMAKLETILLVGGGMAGLTTATALHQHGFTVELVERRETWQAMGAGFLVHANGMRMLAALGLAAGVEQAGTVVSRWQFCDQQGEVLSETDLDVLWGDAGRCVGIERTKLQGA